MKSIGYVYFRADSVVYGWLNYYGRYNRSALAGLRRVLERRLVRCAQRKYKNLRRNRTRAWEFLRRMRDLLPRLFVHWLQLYPNCDGSMTRAV
ncbi:hypothetical protein KVP09_14680 [Alcaligenaceae bacterium CGII-47]|nr:hypothetical protein [Alcaligenaceae bacterium CGII-47]